MIPICKEVKVQLSGEDGNAFSVICRVRSAMKKAGAFRILSVGRVQGPALALVVNKERSIQKFKSSVYWNVSALVKNGHELLLKCKLTLLIHV